MWDWLREIWYMRGRNMVKCRVVERQKRDVPFDVCALFQGWSDTSGQRDPEYWAQYVHAHVRYVPDDTGDKWQTADETLMLGEGDCEDGAILLANYFVAAGLPWWKVLICVYDKHVVVEYDGQKFDWTAPNDREMFPQEQLWYAFNARHAWVPRERANQWKDNEA
jgi:transglutaminase-like putative cysteine protease